MKFHLDIWTIKQILIGMPEGLVPKVPQYNPAHWGVTEIHGQEISQSVGFLDVVSFINRQFCCPDIKTSFCKLIYSVLYTYRTVFFWEFKSIVLLYDCTIFFLLWKTQPCSLVFFEAELGVAHNKIHLLIDLYIKFVQYF